MPTISYELSLKIDRNQIKQTEPLVQRLFKTWQELADSGDWERDVLGREMRLSFNRNTGLFKFDTAGERDIPDWMADDTYSLLRDIGASAPAGAMVRRTEQGAQADFPVGPNREARDIARARAKVELAVETLSEAQAVVPQEIADDLGAVIRKLMALTA